MMEDVLAIYVGQFLNCTLCMLLNLIQPYSLDFYSELAQPMVSLSLFSGSDLVEEIAMK